MREFLERHERLLLEVALVFAVALVPRLYGIGLFLTADEKSWIGRSYEFLKAMKEFRFNDTLQTTHPGIPTLWVAGVATFLATRVFHTPFNFDDLHRFVAAAQVPMAIVNALLVVGIFLAARLLLPPRLALLGSLAVALDPFLIGYSKVVHVDAFLAGFLVIAALLFLYAEQTKREWALVASAVMGALAILSKIPGAFIVPFALLVLYSQRSAWTAAEFFHRLRFFGAWLFLLTIVVLLLWPALLWVPNPLGNANIVRRDLTTAFVTPHHMAESYTLNPWHYPATLLTRTTIPTLLGLAVLALSLLFPRVRSALPRFLPVRTLVLLVAFLVLFLFLMLLGAKKGDRYLLPLFPILDILGVIGLVLGVRLLLPKWRPVPIAAFLVVGVLVPTLVRLGPYALAYYNPLFPPNVSQELGWGEGLDQVAAYLDAEAGDAVAASWYPEELRALTKKSVLHINAHEQVRIGYVVLYRNMFGRSPDHWANDFIDEYFKKRTPVFVARVNGLPYAWVYRKPVYSAVIGELTPGKTVIGEVPAARDNLSRVDVLTATYSGRATEGTLILRVRETLGGPDLRVVRRAVRDLTDNRFATFSFEPLPRTAGKTLFILLTAEGTRMGNAPSVRAAPKEEGRHYAVLAGGTIPSDVTAAKKRSGVLGLRWFFTTEGREISREEAERDAWQ